MKKQKTLLIVVLIVAIAMVGLYLAMGLMSGKEEKTGDDVKKIPMLTYMDDVTYVQYTSPEGMVTFSKTGDTWKSEDKPELILVDGYVDEKASELGKIEGVLVAEAVKIDCGLEEPAYTLTVKSDDKTVTLFIGVSEDGKYYASIDGKEDIYEIQEKVIDILNLTAEDFSEPDGDMSSYYENLEEEAETLIEEDVTEVGDDVATDVIADDSTTTEDTTFEDTIVEDTIVEDTTEEDTTVEDTLTEE